MSTEWKQRPEGGGRFAIWLIRAIALYGGRRAARLCLYPITGYFYLRRGPERLASAQYLQRVFGYCLTGATSELFEPTKASLPIMVLCLLAPS